MTYGHPSYVCARTFLIGLWPHLASISDTGTRQSKKRRSKKFEYLPSISDTGTSAPIVPVVKASHAE